MAESEPVSSTLDEGAADDTSESTAANPNGKSQDVKSALQPLKSKQVVIPLAASAATAAAVFGARRGSSVAKKAAAKVRHGGEKLQEKGAETASEAAESAGKAGVKGAKKELAQGGGIGGIAGKVVSKVTGGGGDDSGREHKKTRRLPIQRWVDVAVPVEEAYEKWTNFEEFPKFMHRVLDVERQEGEGDEPDTVKWREKIWFSKREWQAEVTEDSENDRIAWRTLSGTNHSGVVSFHRLDDNLTRVLVTVDFRPAGLFEKMASGLRFAKRAVQADLARFKAYAEFGRESTGEEPEARERREEQEEKERREQEEQPSAQGDEGARDEDAGHDDEAADQAPRAASRSGEAADDADEARREREARRAERQQQVSA
jgi:uncharacterized membrane protein